MEASPLAILKLLVPKIPFILTTALKHSFSLSPTSSKWDLRTEVIINILREMLNGDRRLTITQQQKLTVKDAPVKGKVWVSRITIPPPTEDDIRQLLFKTIDDMKVPTQEQTYTQPEIVPLEAEWNGYRAGVSADTPEPPLSEKEKYDSMMKEVTSDCTVLFFHGGAYYLLDPALYRPINSKYAKLTGGRFLSVRYRLAPQHAFPTALLDALMSYLSLLYPAPDMPHAPVPASHIVLSGDSAGGNLAMAFLQTLLQMHRSSPPGKSPTILYNGKEVEIPLPAGMATSSPWADLTRSLPSQEANAKYDYLPAPVANPAEAYPSCSAWPTSPPREDLFCDGNMLCHPLVSPVAALSWEGGPPMFIGCGEEMMADEAKIVAQRAARQGVTVVWEQYEAMPHCFSMLLPGHPASDLFYETTAQFCKTVVEKKNPEELKASFSPSGHLVRAKTLRKEAVDVTNLTDHTDDSVKEIMDRARARICSTKPDSATVRSIKL